MPYCILNCFSLFICVTWYKQTFAAIDIQPTYGPYITIHNTKDRTNRADDNIAEMSHSPNLLHLFSDGLGESKVLLLNVLHCHSSAITFCKQTQQWGLVSCCLLTQQVLHLKSVNMFASFVKTKDNSLEICFFSTASTLKHDKHNSLVVFQV